MENQTMTLAEKALLMHEKWNGKLETIAKSKVNSREDLAIAYTPGVAEPCKMIAKDPEAAYKYTMKANTVAVISDGSAVLGLGNIGAYAAMPVMEGKCVLFKEFGDVNAVPICLDTQDTEEIITTIKNIAPAYGGINLEDISAPRCFEIEERLKEMLNIPVFHDDQHGTAIVVLAGIINGLRSDLDAKDRENARLQKLLDECNARECPPCPECKEVANLQPTVIFRQGKSVIDPAQYAPIELIASYMKNHPEANVKIDGYASPEGPLELNKKLSVDRANAVKNALVKKYRISAKRLSVEGHGPTDKLFDQVEFNRVVTFNDITK